MADSRPGKPSPGEKRSYQVTFKDLRAQIKVSSMKRQRQGLGSLDSEFQTITDILNQTLIYCGMLSCAL